MLVKEITNVINTTAKVEIKSCLDDLLWIKGTLLVLIK
jgi:hypothetical protein